MKTKNFIVVYLLLTFLMLFSCKKDDNSGGLPDGTAKMTVNGTEVNFDMCILSVSNYYGYKITQIYLDK